MKKINSLLGMLFILLLTISCEQEDEMGGRSHNSGKNCLGCHSNFKLAGTVYNESFSGVYSGSKIKISTQPNGLGTVLFSLSSDSKGNFYTSNTVNFGTGLYVSVEGKTGTINYMSSAVTTGACNSCHGNSTSRIWAE